MQNDIFLDFFNEIQRFEEIAKEVQKYYNSRIKSYITKNYKHLKFDIDFCKLNDPEYIEKLGIPEYDLILNYAHNSLKAKDIIRMQLIYINSHIEYFMYNFIKEYLIKKKQKFLNRSNTNIHTILKYFDENYTIDDLIESEIEVIIGQGIEKLQKYFLNNLEIDLSKINEWNCIVKNHVIRNVIIHNNGKIQRKHLKYLQYSENEFVEITYDDIINYISSVKSLVSELHKIFLLF